MADRLSIGVCVGAASLVSDLATEGVVVRDGSLSVLDRGAQRLRARS